MNRNGKIRRGIILTLVAAILISGCGSAGAEILLTQDTEAILPDGVHRMTLPAGMISLTPGTDEPDLKGIFQREPDLEMLVYAYDAQGATIEGTAEKLRNAGRDAELRRIGDEIFLAFRDRDDADNAPCIGYAYLYEGWMIEIAFFYSTNEAGEMTKTIMESFRE